MKKKLFLFFFLFLSARAEGGELRLQGEIQAIALNSARSALLGKKTASFATNPHPSLARAGGVFVTITEGGKTRGCWGSVEPQTKNLATEIALDTRKALFDDYRFRPVNPAELKKLRFYVSLVQALEPIEDWRSLRPMQEGLLVSSGGRGGVLLPGEARTSIWQVNECRRKAGIMPGKPVRMFKFKTTVYGPLEP
ncbi:MAG TPA: AMMECR1 domain-containing protein [Chroococcales cyanobacterium]|jgi:AMMECR1 domain-containing protein